MRDLTESQKSVLSILNGERGLTHKQIVKRTPWSPRTVRYALLKLKARGLIIAKMNFRDMREIVYSCNPVFQSSTSIPNAAMKE